MSLLELLKKKFLPRQNEEVVDNELSHLKEDQEESVSIASDREIDDIDYETSRDDHTFKRSRNYQEKEKHYPKWVRAILKLVPSPRNPIRQFWRRYHIGKILVIICACFVLIVGSYLFYLSKTAKVSDLQSALKATTVIYDKNGESAGSLSGQKGTYVELDAISDNLEQAVIATEDRSFYKNKGVNFSRFFLAILTGGHFGGGSTITQQLAKNAYLSQEQSIKRKAREFFLALELTKKYTKDQILTMYLNNAYFGNGVWGVEDASQKYFGVSAADLTVDEAATLAGMLKGPEIYNPYYSTKNATNRRNTVLGVMVDAKVLTEAQAKEYESVDMSSRLQDTYQGKSSDYKYPSYFDAVINEAISKYGLSEKDIVNNGYRIYTELDQNYQTGMQTTFDNDALFPVSDYDGTSAQAASVALDPKTGGVRGLVGRVNSTENPTFRSFNYATQSKRSPGSTIKPLIVYSPAIAAGWSIDTSLPNSPMDFNGYTPNNYGGIATEDIPMYQALANSYNIPAVYTVDKLGISKAISYGKKFGLDMDSAKQELGIALGGGVVTNPLEMAEAYSTFATGGVKHQAHLISRIENANGKVVKSFTDKATRVISQSVSDKMTSMMLGTFSNGTAVNANVYGYTMAGKTGTTETDFNADLASDQWVIGYTPDVVISQWVGFNKTDENHYLSDSSAGTASTIFSTEASYILPYTEGTTFTQENAYAQNGIAATYSTTNETDTTVDSGSKDIIDSIKESAQEAGKTISNAVEDAHLKERAESVWNSIIDYFR